MKNARFSASVLLFSTPFVLAQAPQTRAFHLEYAATVKDIPAGAAHLHVWLPVPHSDPYQQITNLHIDAPCPYRIENAANGNQILYIGLDRPAAGALSIRLTLDAVRTEHAQPRLSANPTPPPDEDSATLAQYLKSDRLVPIDGQIRAWANEVVSQAGAHSDLVVSTVRYDKTGKGWGRGDIYYACEERRGNCTDFHAIVIGYARALGIPARFAIGFPIPAQRGAGKIAGYHCWAEVYVKQIGWIPIDASEAAKNPAKRDYYFGTHDENRLELSKDRDIVLVPRQQGDPLNYFVYPYAEIDGEPFANITTEVTYHDAENALH
jgi:transglutaminase-like putative cysteine protease